MARPCLGLCLSSESAWTCLLAFLGISFLICKLGVDEDPFVFLKIKKKFFFCFWLCWVFTAAFGLSLVPAGSGSSSSWGLGSSLLWLFLLWGAGFSHGGFSSWGTRASLLHGMWNFPGPGIEPMSPALAGGFLPPAPLEKSQDPFLIEQQCQGNDFVSQGTFGKVWGHFW